MNVMEIRGNFVSLIVNVDDANILKSMFEKCLEVLKSKDPLLAAGFSTDFVAELDEAILKSDNEKEDIPNEAAFKLFHEWANQ